MFTSLSSRQTAELLHKRWCYLEQASPGGATEEDGKLQAAEEAQKQRAAVEAVEDRGMEGAIQDFRERFGELELPGLEEDLEGPGGVEVPGGKEAAEQALIIADRFDSKVLALRTASEGDNDAMELQAEMLRNQLVPTYVKQEKGLQKPYDRLKTWSVEAVGRVVEQ